jgi:hypothetical protein
LKTRSGSIPAKIIGIVNDNGVSSLRSCRTFVALYCRKKKTLVHKNLPCKENVEKK